MSTGHIFSFSDFTPQLGYNPSQNQNVFLSFFLSFFFLSFFHLDIRSQAGVNVDSMAEFFHVDETIASYTDSCKNTNFSHRSN